MTISFFLLLLLCLSEVIGYPAKQCAERYQEDPAVTRFRRYIQIDTSKQQNLPKAVEFWRKQAIELGLPFHVFYPAGLPICVITLLGSDPSLPSIILNSHMDVVPANEDEWLYPPYSAYMDEKGDIYGRGSQDAKDVSCQYMEAVRRLKQQNVALKRNIHITIMPDEETGGFKGMKAFVKTEAFKVLNAGFVLDEGVPTPNGTLVATYQDRRPWQMQVTVHGDSGHGSGMPDNTAMEKARRFINIVSDYRDRMKAVMRSVGPQDYGAYTSLNVNVINGGSIMNIITSYVTMGVDMRLSVDSNTTEMDQIVNSWVAETGPETELKFIRKDDVSKGTVLDNSNPYWIAMKGAVNDMNLEIIPVVCPATSDSLVLRNLGLPAVGFAPKLYTDSLIHAKNEHLNANTFLNGIDIYCGILTRLANVQFH